MLVLTFMTDFVKITLATDNVRPSPVPDTWKIQTITNVAVVIGICMVCEALGLLWAGSRFTGISFASDEIQTFSFLILLFMGLFSILCIRERGPFWKSHPSKELAGALLADGVVGVVIGYFGIGDLPALGFPAIMIALFGSAILSLGLNDFVKIELSKLNQVNSSVAKKC